MPVTMKRNRMIRLPRATAVAIGISLGQQLWNSPIDAFLMTPPSEHRMNVPLMTSSTPFHPDNDDTADLSVVYAEDGGQMDDDDNDLLNTMDWDSIEEDEDYDEDIDADPNDVEATMNDGSIHDIFQEWLSIQEERASSNQPKIAVVPQLFPAMVDWNLTQFHSLLQSISRQGSIRDAEALLYHMIQQGCATDETFYHVFAAYRYRLQKHPSKGNRRKWGTAFKLEQLLALQDALNTLSNRQQKRSNLEPSARTLMAVLQAMAFDRTDAQVAQRARRVWDRLRTIRVESVDDSYLYPSVVAVLQACAHVRSGTAADKLASFTVALDVFNVATTTESRSERPQSRIYTWFLRACRQLLAETAESKRDAVVDAAFRRGCLAGWVNPTVLKAFAEVASDTLMLRVLGGFMEDGLELPQEWSRSCAVNLTSTIQVADS